MSRRVLEALARTAYQYTPTAHSSVLLSRIHSASSSSSLPLLCAAAAAAASLVAYGAHSHSFAEGSSPMHQVKLAGLRQWLQEHGADVGAIEIGDDKVRTSSTSHRGTVCAPEALVKSVAACRTAWALACPLQRPSQRSTRLTCGGASPTGSGPTASPRSRASPPASSSTSTLWSKTPC